jgi:hypothetical protein
LTLLTDTCLSLLLFSTVLFLHPRSIGSIGRLRHIKVRDSFVNGKGYDKILLFEHKTLEYIEVLLCRDC